MVWWPFIDGHQLTLNVDLEALFETLPADRMMNVMDTIIVDDALTGAMVDGGIEKLRTKILSVYNVDSKASTAPHDMSDPIAASGPPKPMPKYTELTDEGYVGLEAPFG